MKPAPFAYVRPGSLADALSALAGDPGAKVLAGGQSLVPLLSMRLAAPSTVVDINGLPGLDDVTVSADLRHMPTDRSGEIERSDSSARLPSARSSYRESAPAFCAV